MGMGTYLLDRESFKSTYSFTLSASFKHPKLPISFKTPVALLQIVYIFMTAKSPNLSS